MTMIKGGPADDVFRLSAATARAEWDYEVTNIRGGGGDDTVIADGFTHVSLGGGMGDAQGTLYSLEGISNVGILTTLQLALVSGNEEANRIFDASGQIDDWGFTAYGGGGNDVLTGSHGTDILFGDDGDDLLDPGPSGSRVTDMLSGGAGFDTARIRFRFADAKISGTADAVTIAADGETILATGIERYVFDDRTLDVGALVGTAGPGTPPQQAATVPSDFDGNGLSDILWRHVNGSLSTWAGIDGDQMRQGAFNAAVDSQWRTLETADFNGDGRSDILWRHTSGTVSIWTGTADGAFKAGAYTDGSVSSAWSIAATGDFNGDGKADLLWRHQGGGVSIWRSNGDSFDQSAYNHAPVPTDWKIIGTGDVDGDGRDDILWRNGAGDLSVWRASGDGFTEAAYDDHVGRDWQIDAIADFTGDGLADILWRHNSGELSVWSGNDTGYDKNSFNDRSVGTEWTVAATLDFNGDGRADILWHNRSGAVSTWQSNGASFDQGVYNSAVPANWSVVAHDFGAG